MEPKLFILRNNFRQSIMKQPVLLFLLALILSTANAQTFDPKNIREHIKTLADDSFQGRGTGTSGEKSASIYIESAFKKLKLQPKGDNQTFFQSFPFKKGTHGEGEAGAGRNIVAYLDNGAKTTIIIGAHYDHLGIGEQGGSLDANPKGKIHNGADDNASGVAGVIELAKYFTTNTTKENNNFLFLCFSGEEMGLI